MKRIPAHNIIIAAIALITTIVYIMLTVGKTGQTTFDDAYMVSRYAKHWLMGEGFSWNPIDGPSYGVTSPTYLFVITAVLGIAQYADATALTLTSYAAGILSIASMLLLGFIVQSGYRNRISWSPILVVPAILVVPNFAYHSLTGMETTLSLSANAFLACSIVYATRKRTRTAMLLCLLSGLFSIATRPDNGLYALLLPPLFFVANDRRLYKYAITYISLLTLLIMCSIVAGRLLFGDFLPLPFFAKSGGFYHGYTGTFKWNAMKEMFAFWTAATPFLLVIVATTSRRSLAPLLAIAFVISISFLYYASVTQIMGWNARYYYPSMAFVVFAAYITAFSGLEERPATRSNSDFALRCALGLAILLPTNSEEFRQRSIHMWQRYMISQPVAIQSGISYKTPSLQPLPKLGWWKSIQAICDLLKDAPQGTVLAASEYGFIGSQFPGLSIIDLVGLHDRTIAHQGFNADYVMSRRPDIIWLPHPDYTGAIAKLLEHPSFQSDYDYYPGAYDYGIALRRNTERYDSISEIFNRQFLELYGDIEIADQIANPDTP